MGLVKPTFSARAAVTYQPPVIMSVFFCSLIIGMPLA